MVTAKHIILRIYVIFILLALIFLLVIIRSFSIINDGRENIFIGASAKIQQRSALIEPRRGEVLDINGSPLVTSVAFYDIYMDPTIVKKDVWQSNIQALCDSLSKVFPEKTPKEFRVYLENARTRKNRYVPLRKNVSNDTRKRLRTFPILELGRFKGGIIDNKATIVRKRPHDELLRRTIGYHKISSNNDTLSVGIEGAFNTYLAGKPGEVLEQKISNSWKPTGTVVREAIDGYDLVTSIDKDIQEVAHTELERQLKSKGGRYGCAIVMDVKTGYIKAMANLSQGADGGYYETYNHAIGTKEVPGSTFKLASLMAALEDKKIRITDTVNAVGQYEFYGSKLNDSRPYGYGKITIKEAFEVSSNVISKVIHQNYSSEPQRFLDHLNAFGLTTPIGIDLAGERTPNYSYPGSPNWWAGSLAWMSIGYEFQLTPLQMLSFYNAVANDGVYMKPQFVTHVKQGNKIIKTFEPEVLREQICSPATIQTVKDCLEGVIISGTGKMLKSTYFTTAGKTGTAQISNRNEGYGEEGEKKYIASFAGYFPADNPIYSCIVVVAAPTDDIYGATVSGTVFAAIANKVYATSLSYHKAVNEENQVISTPQVMNGNRMDLNEVLNTFSVTKEFSGNQEWVKANTVSNKVIIQGKDISKNTVPNVVGMGLRDALYLLENSGLHVRTKGFGKVKKQSIPPGTKAVIGGLIEIELEQ